MRKPTRETTLRVARELRDHRETDARPAFHIDAPALCDALLEIVEEQQGHCAEIATAADDKSAVIAQLEAKVDTLAAKNARLRKAIRDLANTWGADRCWDEERDMRDAHVDELDALLAGNKEQE